MSATVPFVVSPAVCGARSIDPHLGPNRAARRELAREDRLDRKRLRKAVASIEHVIRRGRGPAS